MVVPVRLSAAPKPLARPVPYSGFHPGAAMEQAKPSFPEDSFPEDSFPEASFPEHRDADALIEVLHQVQQQRGYLPAEALAQVARDLALPLSRVHGVATFYHLFALQPPTSHCCSVCLGTACFVKGAGVLVAALEQRLGLRFGARSPQRRDAEGGDGDAWSLREESCVGACAQAPVLRVDGQLVLGLPVTDPSRLAACFGALALPDRAAEAA